MFRYLFFIVLVAISTFVLSCTNPKTSTDQAEKVYTIRKGTLSVAMELRNPPFEGVSTTKKEPHGYSVDLAQALASFLGLRLLVVPTPWHLLIPGLRAGRFDAIISSLSITAERERLIRFSDPYAQMGMALLIHQGEQTLNSQTLDQFSGSAVVIRASTAHELMLQNYPLTQLYVIQDTKSALNAVEEGLIKAYIEKPAILYRHHKNSAQNTRIDLRALPKSVHPLGIAVNLKNKALLDKINLFLAQFKKEGGFRKLAEEHLIDILPMLESHLPSFNWMEDPAQ